MRNERCVNRLRRSVLALFALLAVCLLAGCSKHRDKIDLSEYEETETATEAEETEAETETTRAVTATTAAEKTTTGSGGVTATIKTYSSGKVAIQYPVISGLPSSADTDAVNDKLRTNAIAIIEGWDLDEEKNAVEVSCEVLAASRNRVTAVYTGTVTTDASSYAVNVFFSNTIDVSKVEDVGLSDFADPYTLAGYVLSDDCTFYNADGQTSGLMEAKNDKTLKQYQSLFEAADFPVSKTFPECFSYEYEGTIFFSIPVSHALGDYAIVAYTPETK
ncbi:MAG: DUF4163 domain-containing protein [Clostridiales bacterium]|nr:DUF4163 domain-containing protein [Clostridiales bacterium]